MYLLEINDLVRNISTAPFKFHETEAFQFGLKFTTGLHKKHELLDIVNTNYKHVCITHNNNTLIEYKGKYKYLSFYFRTIN